uniref:Uncharacterized protein n=1 Tax=viral metagenome TaxID=1070528 RepID=A0A6C0CXV9_9ZZZZ
MSDIDILNIDIMIRQNFENESRKLIEYEKSLDNINKSLNLNSLNSKHTSILNKAKNELEFYIYNIKDKTDLNFYISESIELLEQYKNILKIPQKMSFVGKQVKNDKEKQKIIDIYLEIASKYVNINIEKKGNKPSKIICNNCSNKKEFEIEGDTYICNQCFSQQIILRHTSSFNDVDRVNISSKYIYDRKIHFRDCINQYQGTQNSTVEPKVYNDLEEQFELHHLLIGEKDTPKEKRFANITKVHVTMFLKELGYTKHYENVHLIHYNITGIQPDQIGYLEEQLLDDFDILIELYDKMFKNINRKNFINTQYVLFQLLTRHKHPCTHEDFTILKTIDRKNFHDDVCRQLFEHLGWNFHPIV